MVQADIGNDSRFRRINDIGRIQRASHSDFHHHQIALHLLEIQHADGCDQLKLARMIFHGIRHGTDPFRDLSQCFFRNVFSVDLDPFPEIFNKR